MVRGVFLGVTVTGLKAPPRVEYSSSTKLPVYFRTKIAAEAALKHIRAHGIGKSFSVKSVK